MKSQRNKISEPPALSSREAEPHHDSDFELKLKIHISGENYIYGHA